MSKEWTHGAKWTNDCQGKQDFDGPIVSLSTRYWPRGGGFFVFDASTGAFEDNDARPQILPSATSALLLHVGVVDGGEVTIELAKAKFEAETEGEVKAAVEAWAADRYKELVATLRSAYEMP